MADQKVSLYSIADLKNTSDDAVPNYLNSLGFKQSHTLSDVRLALGYLAFAISAATFYWDYKLGFESTKFYTATAVAVYAFLNGVLTFWIWGVEKGKIYVGTSSSGDKVEISSSTQKYAPIYSLTVTYYTASAPSAPNTLKISKPFTQWFDGAGHFVAIPLHQMFASEVPVIGKADPMKAVPVDGKLVQKTGSSQGLQPALAERATGTSVSEGDSSVTPRKSGKSRKKA